jgi:uncharacterized protein YjiK
MDVEIEAFIDNSKGDGHSIKLHLQDRHKIDVDEPSDLAINPADGKLYTVSDRHSKVYRLSHDGDVKDEIDVEGTDIEAIAFDADGRLYIGDESTGKIWRLDDDGNRKESIEVVDDNNSGIEGLAFDDDGHLWVAKEKDPARIYELDTDGGQLDKEKIDFAKDLSALTFDPVDGKLYALSDQERTLFRLDKDLGVDKAWKLPIDHPEGIAIDGDTLYVVSDAEERLYVFDIERD